MDGENTRDSEDARHFESLLESHRGILFKVANTYCWCAEDRADLMQKKALSSTFRFRQMVKLFLFSPNTPKTHY